MPASISFGGAPTIVGSTDTSTSGDGTGLLVEYAGAGQVQVSKTTYDPASSTFSATARTFAGTLTADVPRVSYDTYTQSGALVFADGGGMLDGSDHVLPFVGDGSALTWDAEFEAASTLDNADLPAILTGSYTIAFRYHAGRAKWQVAWPPEDISGSYLALAGGTMAGAIDMDGNSVVGVYLQQGTRSDAGTALSASDSGGDYTSAGAFTVPKRRGLALRHRGRRRHPRHHLQREDLGRQRGRLRCGRPVLDPGPRCERDPGPRPGRHVH